MDEDPPLLPSDESPFATSSLGQVWARIHCTGVNLDSQDRSLASIQVRIADQQCGHVTLASLVHEVRYEISVARLELDQSQQKLQNLEDRLVRCEKCLNLDALD